MTTADEHTFGPSRFVTLADGRKLHYRARGTGSPTVVFESGMGYSGSIWGLVQPDVAVRATTVVYDRAGTGRSDDDSAPRSLARIVDDLSQLLRTLEGPFVLVGSSWGGPIIRSLAAGGEFDVHGLVLVDQSDENADEFFTAAGEKRIAITGPIMMFLARTRISNLIARIGRRQPADVYADLRRFDSTVRAARTMGAEVREFLSGMRRLRAEKNPLTGIDVAVISGMKTNFLERRQRPAVNRAHRITAETLDRGRFVPATGSAHYVMFSEPDIIVGEIIRMIAHSEK